MSKLPKISSQASRYILLAVAALSVLFEVLHAGSHFHEGDIIAGMGGVSPLLKEAFEHAMRWVVDDTPPSNGWDLGI